MDATRPEREVGRAVRRGIYDVLSWLLIVGFLALVLYPIGTMVVRALRPADADSPLSNLLSDPSLPITLLNTAIVVFVAGSLALVVGSLFAWINERTDAGLGWFGSVVPLVPLILPPVALSVGWVFLAHERAGLLNVALRRVLGGLGIELETGPLNVVGWPGLIFVYTLFLVPFVYIAIRGGLRSLDQTMEEASRTSGAGLLRTMRDVTLPSMKPAIVGAMMLIVIFAVAVYSIPATLGLSAGIRVLSVEIVSLTQSFPSRISEAVILGLLVLVFVSLVWMQQRRITRRQRHATFGASAGRVLPLGRWKILGLALFLIGYLLLTSLMPLAALALVSLQPFWSPQIVWENLSLANFANILDPGTETRTALTNSVSLGVVAATVTILIAFLLITYSRERQRHGAEIVETVTKVPAAIPHVVIGVAFILALAGPPFGLHGTWLMLLLAYLVIYMPQASIVVGTSYDQVGRELIEASWSSGAGKWYTITRITGPLMRPGLVAGWALLFVLVAGELTASVLLASSRNPVVGFTFIRIWEQGTYSQLAALSCLLALISIVIVALAMTRARVRVSAATGPGG